MNHKKPSQPLTDFVIVTTILNKIGIFAGLNETQLRTVMGLLEKVTFEKDELIFQQGEASSSIYIIGSGKVKLYVDVEGTILELIEFGTGDCFGENSLIGIEPHTASALAVERVELIILSASALLSLYEHDKEVYIIIILNIAREISRRLNKTDNVMTHYVLDSNRHR